MADTERTNATGTRVRHEFKKRSVLIATFAICAAAAFSAPAHAQSWLNNALGSVTSQVEQGVQQTILGNGTQTQPSTPPVSPPQQEVTSAPSYSPPSPSAPSWATPPSSALPNCDQTTPTNVDGTIHHQPCTLDNYNSYSSK